MSVSPVLAAVATAVAASSVTTDAGAPSQFHLVDDVPLEESAEDRGAVVRLVSVKTLGRTGTNGTKELEVAFTVDAKFINEGRDETEFHQLIGDDISRLQDRVVSVVGSTVENMTGIWDDGEATLRPESTSIFYASIPFRCVYRTAIFTE